MYLILNQVTSKMEKKEFHHFQFIDPTSGEAPLSMTLMIKYNYKGQETAKLPPLSANDLLDLEKSLNSLSGNFAQQLMTSENKQSK